MKAIVTSHRIERDELLARAFVPRQALADAVRSMSGGLVKVVIGPRRAGKSVFALQMLFASCGADFAYVNFDDERLAPPLDLDELLTAMVQVYGETRTLFFDEIQNAANWELFVNMVAVELFRRSSEYYAYKTRTGQEVDFLLRSADGPDRLLQVCYDLSDPKTRRREFQALASAGSELGLSGGTVLTWDEEGIESVGGYPVELVPSWKWLLGMDKMACP